MKTTPIISFDYAIKYLLKDKSGYEIIEGFLSALLQAQGYSAVKIKALLDTESNREERSLKRSIADVIVEDVSGNKYVIEIDRAWTKLFLHKACFNTSRLIVDSISSSDDYSSIKKVIHINLLYEPLSEMESPLYHGKTIIKEMGAEKPIDLHLEDMGGRIFDAHNIFPEYIIIAVPLFNDIIKQELDEWLYVMKHAETRDDFKSPYMAKVAERLNTLKMSDSDLAAYREYRSATLKERDYIVSAEEKGLKRGKAEGIAEGIEKGKAEGKAEGIAEGIKKGKAEGKAESMVEIARKMLFKNMPLDEVSEITGLSISELEQLKTLNSD